MRKEGAKRATAKRRRIETAEVLAMFEALSKVPLPPRNHIENEVITKAAPNAGKFRPDEQAKSLQGGTEGGGDQ